MKINFSLEDLTNTLKSWHKEGEVNKDKQKLRFDQIGHDLRSPGNNVLSFNGLFLAEETLTRGQKNIIEEMNSDVRNYLVSLSFIKDYVCEPEKKDFYVMYSKFKKGVEIYFNSVQKLPNYMPFLKKMFLEGKPTTNMGKFHNIIDSGLTEIIYSGNKFFSPKQDFYRIDLDTNFYIKENASKFDALKIAVDKDIEPVAFKQDYVGNVLSYILNNVYDHAFENVEQEEKLVNIEGKIIDDSYILTIKDNGGGIDTNLFPDPNEILQYKKSRRSEDGAEHGKGLYLVNNFVIEQGGNIAVENNDSGVGSKFTVTVPLENNSKFI